MIKTFEQRHALGGIARPCFGGDSSSATTNTTENRDMRVVGGDQSVNVSANDSTVTLTDHGAVKAGLDLGSKALDTVSDTTRAAMNSSGDMFQGALDAVQASNERLALAYQSGQAGDQTTLKYAGFIVVGLAAVMLFAKR